MTHRYVARFLFAAVAIAALFCVRGDSQTVAARANTPPTPAPAVQVQPAHHNFFRVLAPVAISATVADVVTSCRAFHRGGYEANPLMPGSSCGSVAAFSGAVTGAMVFVSWLAHRRHCSECELASAVPLLIATPLHTIAAVHNAGIRSVGPGIPRPRPLIVPLK